jgi:hypothetical protein
MVRKCYTLIIVGASEMENGAENRWKKGAASGRRNHPDFGQYIGKNFSRHSNLQLKHWYNEPRDLTWYIFLPCMNKFNERRKNLLRTILLILNESMLGWRPKTTMTGGLPKLTWEPINPVPLGTMFRNGVEASTGILVYQSVVQHAEVMKQLEFYGERSSLPMEPRFWHTQQKSFIKLKAPTLLVVGGLAATPGLVVS